MGLHGKIVRLGMFAWMTIEAANRPAEQSTSSKVGLVHSLCRHQP